MAAAARRGKTGLKHFERKNLYIFSSNLCMHLMNPTTNTLTIIDRIRHA